MRRPVLLAACLAGLIACALATFTLNDYDIRSEGNIGAKFIMTNNRLIEYNMGLLNPPVATRYITILDICLYDAISYFHPTFIPLIAKDLAPKSQFMDVAGAERALAYSAYRCILELWDQPRYNTTEFAFLDQVMANRSLPITDLSQDNTPTGIGNRAARRVLDYFYNDPANQFGNQTSSDGDVFGDTTNYFPINSAGDAPGIVDCSRVQSLGHWTPLRYPTGAEAAWRVGDTVTTARSAANSVVPKFAGVQASNWKPIAMASQSSHRPPPPPAVNTNTAAAFRAEFDFVVSIFSTLNDTTKMIAEYWNERKEVSMGGPMGRLQEWSCIIAKQQGLNVFESVKLSLLQGVAMYDAAIAAWEAKRFYNHPRPISVIQCLYANQTINSWRGPYQGVGPIPGQNWFSYTSPGASSPPFPGYISGHAVFSGATAEIFRLWNGGNDTLHWQYIYRAGTSLMEPLRTAGDPLFVAGVTDVPNQGPTTVGYVPAQDVVLHWNTFSEAAAQCGLARSYAGVHILPDYTEGNKVGRAVARDAFEKLSCAFRGLACCAPKLV